MYEEYFEDIKSWIKNNSYKQGDSFYPIGHIKYNPGDRKFFEDSRDKIRIYVNQINDINEEISKLSSDELKVVEAVKAEGKLAEIKIIYDTVSSKNKEWKKESLAKLKSSSTPPLTNTAGKKAPDYNLLIKLGEIDKSDLSFYLQITFTGYRKKFKDAEALSEKVKEKVEDTVVAEKVNEYVLEIKSIINKAKETVMSLEKKSDEVEFKKKLAIFEKQIQQAYDEAAKAAKGAGITVGGSLLYYKKYMKYKSKYLQIK